jgi:hypothetical protein
MEGMYSGKEGNSTFEILRKKAKGSKLWEAI